MYDTMWEWFDEDQRRLERRIWLSKTAAILACGMLISVLVMRVFAR